MGRYATQTSVSVGRSKAEIEDIIARYGASEFVSGWAEDGAKAMIGFVVNELQIRINLPLPEQEEFRLTPAGKRSRNDDDTYRAWEQGCRQRWRSLLLVIKAKLEAVDSDITTLEQEFMPFVVMRDGKTIGEKLVPQLSRIANLKNLPPLLPMSQPDDDCIDITVAG